MQPRSQCKMVKEAQRLFGYDEFERGLEVLKPFYERSATELAPSYVAQFSRDGASAGYTMQAVNGEGSYDSMTFYRDGYYNFFLSKDGLTLGLVSFYFRTGGVVQVQQLQGRGTHASMYDSTERLARSELRKILLHPLLLSYVIGWARENGFSQVRLQPAKENEYYKPWARKKKDRELNKRLKRIYDGTARTFGFQLNDDKSYYYLDL